MHCNHFIVILPDFYQINVNPVEAPILEADFRPQAIQSTKSMNVTRNAYKAEARGSKTLKGKDSDISIGPAASHTLFNECIKRSKRSDYRKGIEDSRALRTGDNAFGGCP